MYIPIGWRAPAKIENLDELRQNLETRGGSVIMYRQVLSLCMFIQITPKFVWVEDGTSRFKAGVPYALRSVVYGWWPPMGLLPSIIAVTNNLWGGVDVTAYFRPEPANPEEAARLLARTERETRREELVEKSVRHGFAYLVILVLLVIAIATCGVT